MWDKRNRHQVKQKNFQQSCVFDTIVILKLKMHITSSLSNSFKLASLCKQTSSPSYLSVT